MKKPIPFGKYYLLERVNVGGMAEVFKAKAFGVEGFERMVAVKRILPNIAEDEEFISMFIDEAKIAVQLTHANIAQVFDLGKVDGSYFIALEYVPGRDLRATFDRCRGHGDPMPIAQACFAIMKVCEGLDYAHNKRDASGREMHLVHRDVSPQNVLVSYDGEVKLIDFGIAKAMGKASQTQAGILKGKFGYMSPEQVRGLPIDRRSDVFSVGIVLYELLTNERLFVGESDFSTLEKVRNVEILPPTTYNRKIPEELERIVLKALAKDVDDRYQNAIDLHDELQAFVYTTGEFCSRKDLATWMKRVWAKEVDEEQRKLEEYAALGPPEVSPTPPPAVRPPGARVTAPQSIRARNGHVAQGAPPDALGWDDEELETKVYDDLEPPKEITESDIEVPTPTPHPVSFDDILSSTMPTPVGAVPSPHAGAYDVAALGAATPTPDARTPDIRSHRGASRDGLMARGTPEMLGTARPFAGPPLGLDSMSRPTVGLRAPIPSPVPGAMSPYGARVVTGPQPTLRKSRAGLLLAGLTVAVLGGGSAAAYMLYARNGQPAQISLSSDPPGAYVYVDGAQQPSVGTPVRLSLAAGSYTLALDKPGYERWEKTVTPAAGETLDLGTVTLSPSHPSTLVVDSDPPGAKVQLDGADRGVTPARITGIVPGKHTLVASGPAGYGTLTQEVDVVGGQETQTHLQLTKAQPIVHITSTPPGAQAFLVAAGTGGERRLVGTTPCDAPVDAHKAYEVQVTLDGYRDFSRLVTPLGDRLSETFDAPLEALRPEPAEVASAPPPRPRPRPAPAPAPVVHAAPPPPPPAPIVVDAPPEQPQTGTLKVSVMPASDVFVDGKEIGWTPLKVDLPAGSHTVSGVTNDQKKWGPFPVSIPPGGSYFFKKTDVVGDP